VEVDAKAQNMLGMMVAKSTGKVELFYISGKSTTYLIKQQLRSGSQFTGNNFPMIFVDNPDS
jgi:hypothetical protein